VNREFLIAILQQIENAKREYRNEAALKIMNSPNLFPYLIDETFNINDILSIRAAWVLEWICTHHGLSLLLPHLNKFTLNLSKVHFNGSIRACAKICEHISKAYTSKKTHDIQNILTKKQINTMVEVGFDWLISPQKVAVKTYTLNTLYLFGLHINWIHNALEAIIRKDITHQSIAFQTRGKKIIRLIQKNKTL